MKKKKIPIYDYDEKKPRTTKKGTIEITFYLTQEQIDKLDTMKKEWNAKSRSDIVRMAINNFNLKH